MKPLVNRKVFVVVLLSVASLASLFVWKLHAWAGLNFWVSVGIVVAAVLLNGWVATLEDDLPGSFNNPDGTQTPRYAVVTGRAIRGLGVLLVILCLLALGFHFSG